MAARSPRLLRIEIVAGLVTALALIPEVLAFSILAGVDPAVGLFTSVIMAVTSAVVGGRPAMITAAAGAVAMVTAPLVRSHGVEYLVAAVLLGGAVQMMLGGLGISRLMRFVTPAVMRGFVNALAILMFTAQLPELVSVPWQVYPLAAIGLVVVFLLPRFTRAFPSPFAAIVVVMVVAHLAGWSVPSVGDKGQLPTALPSLHSPSVPLSWETVGVVAPFSLAIALVGLLESLMTQRMVDDLTQTRTNPRREAVGQGLSNLAAGLFGGMGGCAMIGQTMINVKTGGARTRISTMAAGLWLLLLVMVLSPLVARIPMAALVAVMVFVSATTFDWASISPRRVRTQPVGETAVMLLTVAVVVPTHNLAYGVIVGVLASILIQRWGRTAQSSR